MSQIKINMRRWLTDQSYNDELRRQSDEAAYQAGKRLAARRNQIILDAIMGVKK